MTDSTLIAELDRDGSVTLRRSDELIDLTPEDLPTLRMVIAWLESPVTDEAIAKLEAMFSTRFEAAAKRLS